MEPWELPLKNTISAIKNKELSVTEVVKSYFTRIEKVEEKVKAFVSLCKKEALEEAEKADNNIKNGEFSNLVGIPYSAKDMFNTKGFNTTASSKVLENYKAYYNATVINRLKTSGAILIGKTNQDAFAHGSSTENSDFFVSKNPWDLERLPGGSSGGSASAVVSGECAFSLGTETGGSIRHPSSWSGCVGLKPTYGRVSRYGVIAMASSTDSPGVLAKTVEDASVVYETIAGYDNNDATSSVKEVLKANFSIPLKKEIVVGVPSSVLSYGVSSGVEMAFKKALSDMEKTGIKIVELEMLSPKYSVACYTILQRAEVSSNLARYDGIRYGNSRSYFGSEAKKRILLGTSVLSSGYYDKYYKQAQKARTLICLDFKKAFENVDFIVSPTTPSTALKIGAGKDKAMFGELEDAFALPASLAGLPAISVPCGFSENLPVGLQFIAPHFLEKNLLEIAYKYEEINKWYLKKPTL